MLINLRLWHWQQCLHCRKFDEWAYPAKHKLANFHIKQVQVLNDFFDIDDTAEADDNV